MPPDPFLFFTITEIIGIVLLFYIRSDMKSYRRNTRFYFDLNHTIYAILLILTINILISLIVPLKGIHNLYYIIFSIFLAPVLEEMLFRGGALGWLYDYITGKTKINKRFVFFVLLIFSSFSFSLSHIFTVNTIVINLWRLIKIFVDGIFFGLIYWLSDRNLVPVIVAHSALNMVPLSWLLL